MKRVLLPLLLWSSALAHQPHFNPGSPTRAQAWVIPQPTISKVVTAQVRGAGLDWYALRVDSGFRLDATVFVGASCARPFQPKLWLLGPGLPMTNRPAFTPEGFGAVSVNGGWTNYSGHGITARKGQTLVRTLGAGSYFLVVEHDAAPGWYFISLAGSEAGGGTSEGRAALERMNRCA